MDGIDDTIEDLQDLQAAAEELDGDNSVPMEEMFPPEFIREHTEFESFEEWLEGSQWQVDSQEDFEDIPDGPFDDYVAETSDFDDWDDMFGTAGREWAARELGL